MEDADSDDYAAQTRTIILCPRCVRSAYTLEHPCPRPTPATIGLLPQYLWGHPMADGGFTVFELNRLLVSLMASSNLSPVAETLDGGSLKPPLVTMLLRLPASVSLGVSCVPSSAWRKWDVHQCASPAVVSVPQAPPLLPTTVSLGSA